MRFDEASALYAEFGPFVTGMVAPLDDVLDAIGARSRAPALTGADAPHRTGARVPRHRDARCRRARSSLLLLWRSSVGWSLRLSGRGRRRTTARPRRGHGVPPRQPRRPEGHQRPRRRRAGPTSRSLVTDADGDEVGDGRQPTRTGRFELELPGPGTYVAALDVDSLPDGVDLAEGDERREVNVRPARAGR